MNDILISLWLAIGVLVLALAAFVTVLIVLH